MINEKNEFLTGSWLSGGGGGGVQIPTLTKENSQFLQSGSQEVQCNAVPTWVCVHTDWALSRTKNLTGIH